MRAIAPVSGAAAGRIKSFGMGKPPKRLPKTKAPRTSRGASSHEHLGPSAPIARQAQQHQEQVDEVEIERQRPHHHFAAADGAVVHGVVHLLDLLGIPRGQPGEHDHADHRDDPIQLTAAQEDVHQAGQQSAGLDHLGDRRDRVRRADRVGYPKDQGDVRPHGRRHHRRPQSGDGGAGALSRLHQPVPDVAAPGGRSALRDPNARVKRRPGLSGAPSFWGDALGLAMPKLLIRPAAAPDTGAIARIYAHAVRFGTASFELEPPDEAEMARRQRALVEAGYPYLVAQADGAILGYAYAGPYRARPAYRWSVENSVYVDPEAQRRGIGRP